MIDTILAVAGGLITVGGVLAGISIVKRAEKWASKH
jgi:hypothetical protein